MNKQPMIWKEFNANSLTTRYFVVNHCTDGDPFDPKFEDIIIDQHHDSNQYSEQDIIDAIYVLFGKKNTTIQKIEKIVHRILKNEIKETKILSN